MADAFCPNNQARSTQDDPSQIDYTTLSANQRRLNVPVSDSSLEGGDLRREGQEDPPVERE